MGAMTKTASTVEAMLSRDDVAAKMTQALARGVDVQALTRVAVLEINKSQQLQRCSPATLLTAIVDAGRLGLAIGSSLGQAYLVPYGTTCTLIIGYRGLIELARRSGGVQKIEAHAVHANDEFVAEYGSNERLEHKPVAFGDRGDVIGFYAIALLDTGARQFVTMDLDEVNAIRDRSRAAKSGPWVSDYAEMGKKTVVRRLIKMLPLSIEAKTAIEADDERSFRFSAQSQPVDLHSRYAPAPQQVEPSEVTIDGDDQRDWYEEGGENMASSNGGEA